MDIRVGTDIVPVSRLTRLIEDGGTKFLDRWFTPGEVDYCVAKAHPARHFAARLAAKEAVFKALAADSAATVPWRDIEIVLDPGGAPGVRLSGAIGDAATRRELQSVRVSLSHCDDYATATAIVVASR